MRFSALFFFLALFAAGPALAEVKIYQCQIKERGKSGWIPTVVIVSHDEKTGNVLVADPVGHYFNDKRPIVGTIPVENKKRITFRWVVEGAKDSRNQFIPDFVYRGTFVRKSKSMTVTAKPLGYDNNFSGKGPCKITAK